MIFLTQSSIITMRAPVAQGTEQRTSNPLVAGSNPAERAILNKVAVGIHGIFYFMGVNINYAFGVYLGFTTHDLLKIYPHFELQSKR